MTLSGFNLNSLFSNCFRSILKKKLRLLYELFTALWNIWAPVFKDTDLVRFSEIYVPIFAKGELIENLFIHFIFLKYATRLTIEIRRIWYKNTFFFIISSKDETFLNELALSRCSTSLGDFSGPRSEKIPVRSYLARLLLSPVLSTFLKWQTRVVNQFSAIFSEPSITQRYYFTPPYN